MEVILKEDIKGLGYKNDIVKVRPGYGRNYLIPKNLAIVATESAKKVVAENLKQAAHKAKRIKDEALNTAAKLAEITLTIKAKVGETGKIFGAVTSLQISDALKEKGFTIDRKKISFKTEVREVGDYIAIVDLHKEVKQEVKFSVVPE
ncbi:MAG: 50S ribosomal protein L9 [Cytophagaceae bacterium]|nr:50S ribosomal protein L9 [Cytophagaceae bacterium]MDW8456027.1 50S ribosomal protein L9 [Cytophagaceae bacterium]